jgi:hypothetical protein
MGRGAGGKEEEREEGEGKEEVEEVTVSPEIQVRAEESAFTTSLRAHAGCLRSSCVSWGIFDGEGRTSMAASFDPEAAVAMDEAKATAAAVAARAFRSKADSSRSQLRKSKAKVEALSRLSRNRARGREVGCCRQTWKEGRVEGGEEGEEGEEDGGVVGGDEGRAGTGGDVSCAGMLKGQGKRTEEGVLGRRLARPWTGCSIPFPHGDWQPRLDYMTTGAELTTHGTLSRLKPSCRARM